MFIGSIFSLNPFARAADFSETVAFIDEPILLPSTNFSVIIDMNDFFLVLAAS
jgi:hypothetical protein